MARIHYVIPDELHRRAKAEASLQGVTLREFIERAIESAVYDEREEDEDHADDR